MKGAQAAAEYRARINRVMDHVAEHIDEPLPLRALARVGCFSPFHFHRIFRAMTGETLGDYIKRQRLEKAVFLKKYTPRLKLTEIAFRCGFNSSADFSRSFKAAYGIAPSRFDSAAFAKKRKNCKALAEHSEYGSLLQMRPLRRRFRVQVMARPAETVAFLRVRNSYAEGNVQAAFERMMAWARARGFHRAGTLIGMSRDEPEITPLEKYTYDVCHTVPEGTARDGEIGIRRIPANRFATLHVQGGIRMVFSAWSYLFKDWLPSSGYQPTHDPAMEVYVRTPEEVGWEYFDLQGCLPVRPL